MAKQLAKEKDLFRRAVDSFVGRGKPLRIGSEAPDFTAKSTAYDTDAPTLPEADFHFYSYINKKWAVFFSHPCNFTPVCTTEIANFAEKQDEFAKRDTRLVGLSVSEVENTAEWIGDIHAQIKCPRIEFPIVADERGVVARLYAMLDQEEPPTNEEATKCLQKLHTIRCVFIIDTKRKIRAMISYPMETGRNIDEIIRVIDSLQLRAYYGPHILTPANWRPGDEVLVRQDNQKVVDWRRMEKARHGLPYMKFKALTWPRA